jgi:hypothetical protein
VLISFGVWGVIGWFWFLAASIRALYLNYRHGPEHLKTVNTFLLSYFVARTLFFFTIFGDFRADFPLFAGLIGFALALNGGIHKRTAVVAVAESEPAPNTLRPGLRSVPAFSR